MTVKDLPENYSFGKRQETPKNSTHDMLKLLTNGYQGNIKPVSIEQLRATLAKKRIPVSKKTYS